MPRCCTDVLLFPLLLLLSSHTASCASRKNATTLNSITTVPPVVLVASAVEAANEAVTLSSANITIAAPITPVVVATTTRRPFFAGARAPCACDAGQCGCCTGVILESFRQKACLNFTYEPDDFLITAKISMNDRVLYKNTFSGKNPPPMCIRVPRFRFVELCVEVSNVYLASRNIHMCVDAEASWEDFTLVEWSFDCFRLGANGVAIVSPEDGGGLPGNPIDEEDQTDEDYDDTARHANSSFTVGKRRIPGKILVWDNKDHVPVMAKAIEGDIQFTLKERGSFFDVDKFLDFWL